MAPKSFKPAMPGNEQAKSRKEPPEHASRTSLHGMRVTAIEMPDAFIKTLTALPEDNPRLRNLLARKPAWKD